MTPQALRKAAIFLASVDDETALALLAQLPQAEAAALRAEWSRLESVDPDQQQAVIDEFVDAGRARPQDAGFALDDSLRLHLETPDDAPALSSSGVERPPFDFLNETDEEQIAQHLAGEHPQAIALVLAHLPLERAAAVLEALPTSVQEEALARLVEADETHPEIVREVERGLEARMGEQARRTYRRRQGEELAQALVAEMGSSPGRSLLARISRRDASLAQRLGYRRQAPQTLDALDANSLADALRRVGPEIAALALAGATADEAERALARLPRNWADDLRSQWARLGPTRIADLETAYRQLLAATGPEL